MSYHQLEAVSAARIREILSRPMSESEDMLGMDGEFDPWCQVASFSAISPQMVRSIFPLT